MLILYTLKSKRRIKNMRQKVNFYIPEGVTGHQFEKFLKRANLHFFHPRRKNKIRPESEKMLLAIHTQLNVIDIDRKMKQGKLIRM
jgi:hypothetical protein